MDGRIRFEYATCGRRNYESGTKKLRIRKYPGTCGQGLSEYALFIKKVEQYMLVPKVVPCKPIEGVSF